MIVALGVPRAEVDLILVNGPSVDISCVVQEGDYISVLPRFESLDSAPRKSRSPHVELNPPSEWRGVVLKSERLSRI